MNHKSGGAERVEPGRGSRKERVLHTRIPAALEEEIKRLADALSIPVSNLVRNILQDTVSMVDTVKEHVGGAVSELRADVQALSSHVTRDRDELRRRWAEYQRVRAPRRERADSGGRSPAVRSELPATRQPLRLDGIFGWQPLTLNVSVKCASCARPLEPGHDAFLGLGDPGEGRIFICPDCLPRPGHRREP